MRTISGAAVAVLLGAALAAIPTTTADAAPDHAAPRVKTVERAYGDGQVYQDDLRQRVRIRFEGRRGDRVRLGTTRRDSAVRRCDVIRLTDGERDVAVDRSRFFRLRHAGIHTFVFTPCPEAASPVRLQLLKLNVRPLRPTLTKVPQRRGFVFAVDVTVPASGTLVVRPTDDPLQHGNDDTFFTGVLPPTGKLRDTQGLETDAFFFEAGRGLYLRHTTPYLYQYPESLTAPAAAGDHYLLVLQYDAVLRASTPSSSTATIGGPGVSLDYAAIPGRAHQITFTATAGQWLFVNRQPPGDAWDDQLSLQLTNADGRVVDQDPVPGVWLIPATGTYRLTVMPYGESNAPPNTLELRSVRSIGAMPADGTPTTLSTTYPGEPVLATVSLAPTTKYLLQAPSVSLVTGWSGFAGSSQPVHCDPNGPLGCQPESGYVFDSVRTSGIFTSNGGPNPWYVLLNPGLGVSGSAQLAITPTP